MNATTPSSGLSAIDSIRQSGSRLMRSFDSMICASIAE
jgi:hypothetical protein